MATIRLRVTQKVLDHAAAGHRGQRQVAMRLPSEELRAVIGGLGHGVRVPLGLGGFLTVVAGDTGAIWETHNADHAEDFETLYALLASKPGREMEFTCEVAGGWFGRDATL